MAVEPGLSCRKAVSARRRSDDGCLDGWWTDRSATNREEKKKYKKQQKHRIISDQQKRKYTKHGCPTILFNIFVVHRTVSVPTAVSVFGVVVHSHGAHRPDSGGDAGRDLYHGT